LNCRPRVFLFALLIASFGFVGCSGLVAGSNGNPPPPSSLVITNVQSGSVTTSGSQVAWTTNVPANSSVDYGTTTAYGNSTPVDSGMVTSHQVALSGLAAGTTYYYQVNSTDSNGNHGHGGNKFKTAGFSLSGTITPTAGGNGATVALNGAASTSATADSSGNYAFAGLPNGTYTIAPSHTGFTFTPGSQSMAVNGANVTGVNFTATAAAVAPTITTQPVNQAVTAGQTATFAVVAIGTAPLSYQWQKNGANIAGATSASYTTPATTTSDSGSTFAVVVSNTTGTVTSSAATLTVNAAAVAPTITTQPANQTVTAGQTASFTAAASGTAPLNYQWQKNSVAIAGATSSSYTTPATASSDNGAQFAVLVSNTAGSATSSAATLTVNTASVAPSITTQPSSQTVTAGQTVSFSVAATGTAPLSYQWQKTSVAIAGATSSSYTTPATASSDNGALFTVVVSNTAGSVTSSAATLTVNAAPVVPSITTQPAGQSVTAGQTASFSVAATGTAPLSYQWQKNSVAIAGATLPSYTTPATANSDNGAQFTVVVSNTAGSVTSSAATLTVNAASVAPSITAQPANQTVAAGQTASFSVAATGTAPLGYQWNKNGTAISGATLSSYTTAATSISDNGALFTVGVSNTAGNVTSNAATLTVNVAQPPSVSITSPANGATVSGTITVSGTASDAVGVSSVQVQVDGGAFSSASGTTNWSFSLDTTSLSNATHTFTARATNSSGLSSSSSVSVNVSNSSGTIVNVVNHGATGNGSTDDTAAINSAIAALKPGDTLEFPSGRYKVSSQLTINVPNVTVDGSSNTATIDYIGGGNGPYFVLGVPNRASFGSAVNLSATANELATSFTTVSPLGVTTGDYVLMQQGGEDYSLDTAPGHPANCDPTSVCRGEVLQVASVSGNSITVTTALHDVYNPSINAARVQKMLNPTSGITIQNITFDGNSTVVYGVQANGVVNTTFSGVTSRNVIGSAFYSWGAFNLAFKNITVTGAGSENCGEAVALLDQGNLSVSGMSLSSLNPGQTPGFTGCLGDGAFGLELDAAANGILSNITINAAGAYGRPLKLTDGRWNTFNSLTTENNVWTTNGMILNWYSSHNTFNNCTIINNGVGTSPGQGQAGINTFGNFNQYNTFNNCTVSGNGNVQFYISGFDALRLAQDSHNTVSGGTFTGSNSSVAVMLIEGDGTFITGATINGPGPQGIYLDTQASNACVNNNTFTAGSGLNTAISANSSGDLGLGNILNLLGSNLTLGVCAPPLP